MRNLIEDLSTLTTIPAPSLTKLADKAVWCIGDSIKDSILNFKDTTEIYIGIGKLVIKVSEDQIKYKFVPTRDLEETLKKVVLSGDNPLEKVVEQTLVDKIIKTYKDLF